MGESTDEIDVVIFDIGGVLLTWAPGRSPSQMDKDWEARLGLEPGGLARRVWATDLHRRAEIGELPFEEYWPTVGAELGLDEDGLADLFADYWDICCFDARVETAVHSVRQRYRTAIISNAWSNARAEVERRYGFDQLFELMVFSAEEGIAKPDSQIFWRTLSRLGVEPGRTFFIDDVAENVAGAQAVGMRAKLSQDVEDLLEILGRF